MMVLKNFAALSPLVRPGVVRVDWILEGVKRQDEAAQKARAAHLEAIRQNDRAIDAAFDEVLSLSRQFGDEDPRTKSALAYAREMEEDLFDESYYHRREAFRWSQGDFFED